MASFSGVDFLEFDSLISDGEKLARQTARQSRCRRLSRCAASPFPAHTFSLEYFLPRGALRKATPARVKSSPIAMVAHSQYSIYQAKRQYDHDDHEKHRCKVAGLIR